MSESTASPTDASKTGVAALDGLFQAVNRSDAPGLVVGVAQHGKTIYRRGFGLASVELGVANAPWTRMRIGSTSKHFTCLAVLLLAEEGKLDPDDSIRQYVPELPKLDGEPTLRQLMTHTGGYRCYLDTGMLANGMAIRAKGTSLAAQVRQSAVNFAPGESMIYCNGGYSLLSLVIARISGMPFEQFLKERILAPMGMVDTLSAPNDLDIQPGMATLHLPGADGGWRKGLFPSEEVLGEGAMISTVDDMLRWLAHLRGPKIVGTEATWAQMTTLSRLNNGSVNPYGLGLMLHDYRGLGVIHHAGGVFGGASQMLTVPSHGLDIIIMTNSAALNPIALANQVVDAMLGDALGPVATKAATERFRPLVGTRYRAPDTGVVISFEDVGGKLGLAFLNNPATPLTDLGDTLRIGFEEIAMGPLTLAVAPLAELREAPASLQMSEAGNTSTFERLPSSAPSLPEAGAALVGLYRAADLDADAEVRFDGDALQLRIKGENGSTLISLAAFGADGFGLSAGYPTARLRGVIQLERAEGRVTAFQLDTTRTRRMRFERLPSQA